MFILKSLQVEEGDINDIKSDITRITFYAVNPGEIQIDTDYRNPSKQSTIGYKWSHSTTTVKTNGTLLEFAKTHCNGQTNF